MSVDVPPRRAARRRGPPPTTTHAVTQGGVGPEFVALAIGAGLLLLLGLVMTFSASFVTAATQDGDAFAIFRRQLLWSVVGAPGLVVAALADYRVVRRFAAPLLVTTLVACALVLVPGIGIEVSGARRWFDLGPVRFQPTELLKLALPLYLAHVVASRWRELRAGDLRALLLPAVPIIALATVLVAAEPDLETAVLVALIGGLVLYAAGLPGRILAAGLAATALVGVVGVLSAEFRRLRVAAWFDPMAYHDTFGFQTVQGFIALGSGGWFGVGLGQGRGKWLYVPNAHTDFIYAIIGEELGLVGAVGVLGLFCGLGVLGLRVARCAPDPFGRLLATALTGWLLLQAATNIGSVVGLLPVTGVTLPLVSFGGSSLVFTMAGIGLLLSVARACRQAAP